MLLEGKKQINTARWLANYSSQKYSNFLPRKAEGTGFEPVKAFTLLPFQGSALSRYANPLLYAGLQF